MSELKYTTCEAPLLLIHKNRKVDANFIFFFKTELIKLSV
jgi:hypothetical protein